MWRQEINIKIYHEHYDFSKQNCEEIISYLTNWTGKKFLEILTKRDLVFFFPNKKKMSGGLNGTALPAYTNFLFVFYVYRDIGKENKKVDWAQHRATSRVVHNTVSQYSYFYYHWIDFKRWK